MDEIKRCNLPYGVMVVRLKRDGKSIISLEEEFKILGQFTALHLGFVKGFDFFEYRAKAKGLIKLLLVYFSFGVTDCLVSFNRIGKKDFCGPSAPIQRRETASLRSAICPRVQHTA